MQSFWLAICIPRTIVLFHFLPFIIVGLGVRAAQLPDE